MLKAETVRLKRGRQWQVYSGGDGAPLLWLHGPRGIEPSDPLLEALGRRRRIIAPLMPGFADLDEIKEIDSIHELALDYDSLLRGLGLAQLPVAGHSFGGMIAAELAAHFPDRASRLVLLAPVGLWNDAYPVADLFACPADEMDKLLWHDEAARAAHAARLAAAGDADEVERLIAVTRTLTALTKFIWPIPDKGLRRRLHRIEARTLLLWGEADRFVPARYGHDFANAIDAAEVKSFAGAGHMLPYERTAEIADAIERFLARN